MLRTVGRCAVLVVCLGLPACSETSDKPEMTTVSGTVTLDGTPLKEGAIVADPVDQKGLPAQAAIVDGKFTLQATPGEKSIRINAVETTAEQDEYGSAITRELIPAEYNSETTLTETVAAVGAEQPEWKFELKSK